MDLQNFLLSFIPLFVAIDIIGTSPIFLGFTHGISSKQRKKLIVDAMITAFVVAIIFLFLGKAILGFLGITINDFRIAGGLILLILSVNDILTSSDKRRTPQGDIGIVPLGIPLIMGPAALATILILNDKYGFVSTITSMLVNFAIIGIVLFNVKWVTKLIGEGGSKAFAKIASLFLAAYAIMMIREGITQVLKSF